MNFIYKIKRLPPILFPLWLIIVGFSLVIKFFMWLVGFWWCDDCHQLGNITTNRYTIKYTDTHYSSYMKQTVHKDKYKHVCNQCYVSKYAETKVNPLEEIKKKEERSQ